MIDAGPSLRAAEGIGLDLLETFLLNAGWEAQQSRGLSLFTKPASGGDAAEIVLPATTAEDEETTRRVADALRTIAGMEGRNISDVADEIRMHALKPAVP
jgi:hypothetical protein